MAIFLALALVASGLALIVGACQTAKRIGFGALAIIIGWWVGRCFLCSLFGSWSSTADSSSNVGWYWALAVLAMAGAGGVAWKTRKYRRERRDERRREEMHPRRLAPPSAPNVSAEDDGTSP